MKILTLGLALALSAPALTPDTPVANPDEDIVEVAKAAGSFTTLLTAVEAAGLVDVLKSEGPFTVFAPTDEAFAKIPQADLEALLQDTEALKAVLLHHVVPGSVKAADVMGLSSAETANGSSVSIATENGTVRVDEAAVLTADIEASNGIIHVIDSVIMPEM